MEQTLRFILIGDTLTGKTTFFNKLINETNKKPDKTIGLDVMTYKDNEKKIIIWDTSGDEKYINIVKSYMRNNCGILLFVDLTRKETFDNLESWISLIETENYCNHKHPIFLIGINNDKEIAINHDKLGDFVVKYQLIYISTRLECIDPKSIMNIIIGEIDYRFKNINCLGIKNIEKIKTNRRLSLY
tara:strand:- start:510 stop:1070 length:561 start_codon:yes stop_codon:yes gene_type:complete